MDYPSNNFRGLVFSHNRAMQLDANIRSYLLHCMDQDEIQLTVIFKATGEQHQKQYEALANKYREGNIRFFSEHRFREDILMHLLPARKNQVHQSILVKLAHLPRVILSVLPKRILPTNRGYLFFIVDDAIFVKDFYLAQIRRALCDHPEALGFSLRLGTNTTYCYTKDIPQNLPAFTYYPGNMLMYQWTGAEADFNYPLEISSSIYRLEDIFRLIFKLSFHNPNLLEGRMAAHAREYTKSMPSLLCFENSVAFCNPINIIQEQVINRSGVNYEYSTDRLAQLFADGYRIDIGAYTGFIPNSCHQEVELVFEKTG